MFRWYKNSEICYAYLADVPDDDNIHQGDSTFSKSRWHSRGWTLQELLAPINVVFYSAGWEYLGTKREMAAILSTTAGISSNALTVPIWFRLETFSIAQRMSWASRRETTRLEDMAYCLMGLFDVNMPLLYGEGERAFHRLQEEIMKNSDDHSLFAWRTSARLGQELGLLAPSPAEFLYSSDIIRCYISSGPWYYRTVNTNVTTNRGIRVEMQLQLVSPEGFRQFYIAWLACCHRGKHASANGIAIILLLENDAYYRVARHCLLAIPANTCRERPIVPFYHGVQQLHVPKSMPSLLRPFDLPSCQIVYVESWFGHGGREQNHNTQYNIWRWDIEAIRPERTTQSLIFLCAAYNLYRSALAGSMLLRQTTPGIFDLGNSTRRVAVFFGASPTRGPWCSLVPCQREGDKRRLFSKDRGKKYRAIPQFPDCSGDGDIRTRDELDVGSGVKLVVTIEEDTEALLGGSLGTRSGESQVFRVLLRFEHVGQCEDKSLAKKNLANAYAMSRFRSEHVRHPPQKIVLQGVQIME